MVKRRRVQDTVKEIGELRASYGWSWKKIAEITGKSHGHVRNLASRSGLTKQRKITFLSSKRCPECGGPIKLVKDENGEERVCESCGLTFSLISMEYHVPYNQTFQPTSALSFNKSLGETYPWVSARGRSYPNLYKILAKGEAGTLDLPIRNLKILSEIASDAPETRRLLSWGSRLLYQLKLNEDRILAEQFGTALRKIAKHLEIDVRGKRVFSVYKRVAMATLVLILMERGDPRSQEIAQVLEPKSADLEYAKTRLTNPLEMKREKT